MSKKNRVIKIMTNKRTQWQNTTTDKKERNRYQSKRQASKFRGIIEQMIVLIYDSILGTILKTKMITSFDQILLDMLLVEMNISSKIAFKKDYHELS